MKFSVRLFTVQFALLLSLTLAKAQTVSDKRAQDWLTLQKLLFKKASASWSLTAADLKQFKDLSTTSSIAKCTDANAVSCTASTLPVTSLVLKGQRTNADKVSLKWETRAEYNSKGFILERQSFTNANVFDSIYYVAGAGISYSKSTYEYLDLNSFSGSSFYRVKAVDKDGKFSYSNTVLINGLDGEFAVNVIPNPTRSTNLRFYFTVPNVSQTIDFTISNASGISLVRNEKFVATNGYYEIKNKTFPPGYYFITVYTQKGVYTKSFVISH